MATNNILRTRLPRFDAGLNSFLPPLITNNVMRGCKLSFIYGSTVLFPNVVFNNLILASDMQRLIGCKCFYYTILEMMHNFRIVVG